MTDNHYDLVVIGSGPGGYVASVRAAQLGFKVACIEKDTNMGGTCLNTGCIPSKALLDSSEYYHLAKEKFARHGISCSSIEMDLAVMMQRKTKVVNKLANNVRLLLKHNKVDMFQGVARLISRNEIEVSSGEEKHLIGTDKILLAVGSKVVRPSIFPYDGKHVVGSTEALCFDKIPEHLVIVGGGYIGLELGSVWRRLGAKVTVVEMLPQIATALDRYIGKLLERSLRKQGMKFHVKTKVAGAEIKDDQVLVTLEKGEKQEQLVCDRLLVAVGRYPATQDLGLENLGVKLEKGFVSVDASYCSSVPGIYAIGDIIAGPMLAHKASAEGVAAVECMAGQTSEVNYDCIPSVIYTWPEVSSVGLTEEQLIERQIPYRKASYPFAGVGRARCMDEIEGAVKICSHRETDRVLGVHIIGPRASDLIAECVLGMEFSCSSEDLARTIHGHPTFSEAIHEAATELYLQSGKEK